LHAHRDTSATVVLTAEQVDLLLQTAAGPRRGVSPLMAARAVAIVALFTLGLRVSEVTGLRRAHLHLTRGRQALRVTGKGDKMRVVYLSRLAGQAVQSYLAERDRWTGTAVPALPGQLSPHDSPLIATRDGGELDPGDVWALLRRIAAAAGPALADVADRFGPHVLRHFYVTAAAEAGADMTHVQADVGHASVDTTQRVYNQAARHPDRSAVDIVENTLLQARSQRHLDRVLAHERFSETDALRILDTGLAHEDPVEQLHGLQQLQQVMSSSALSATTAHRILALAHRTDLHPRVVDLVAVLSRQWAATSP
jgi:integrase